MAYPHRPSTVARSRRRTGLVIATLACCGVVTSLQQTLVLPLLPEFPRLLGTSRDDASWLVTATLLAGAVATPIVGRLADMFGKRELMTACLAVMVFGSLLGSLGSALPLLIAARGLQGVGTALIPVGIAAMRDELPASRVPLGVALMSATLAIGAGLGLPLSGLLAEYLDWHAVFWLTGGVGALMLLAVPLVVGPSPTRTGGRFDAAGAFLLSALLTALLLALTKGGHWGWSSPWTLGLWISVLGLFMVWVPVQLRLAEPLVDMRTTARPAVLLVNAAAVVLGFGTYANLLVTTQQLQLPKAAGGQGLDLLHTGLWMAPSAVAFGAMAPISARMITRLGARSALLGGATVMAGAYVVRALLNHQLWQLVIGSVAVSLGTSLAYAAMPILIMSRVAETETASANGVNTLMRTVGTSVSSATAAAITTAEPGIGGSPTIGALTDVLWVAAGACAAGAVVATSLVRLRTRAAPGPPPSLPEALSTRRG